MNKKEFKVQFENEVATALIAGTKTYTELAVEFGISEMSVYLIAKARKIRRKRGLGSSAAKFKRQQQAA
jgi:hypothetical protein